MLIGLNGKHLSMVVLILLDSHSTIKLGAINFDFKYVLLRCQIEIYKISSPQDPISLLIFFNQNVNLLSCLVAEDVYCGCQEYCCCLALELDLVVALVLLPFIKCLASQTPLLEPIFGFKIMHMSILIPQILLE